MRVKFTARGGWPYEIESAKKSLDVGETYEAESITIGKWCSYLKLENGKSYNHCLFEQNNDLEDALKLGESDKIKVFIGY